MISNLSESLDGFIHKTMELSAQQGRTLTTEYDSEWPSPCYTSDAIDGEMIAWEPQFQSPACSFENLEKALEMTLNEEFCQFFTRYFSFNLMATAVQGRCELLQVSSIQDFERLQENLIGHVLMKKRLKQPPTLFFALTDDDDFILSVDNASGEVMLEQVGRLPEKPVSESLSVFLHSLTPIIP